MTKETTSQRDAAYQKLRPLLLHGQIQPSTRLGETQWAQQLGVNRSALREAFSLLAHEGLLKPGEKGGHFVPLLERADLDQILELRVILETGAIRQLAQSQEPIDTSALQETCRTMRLMIESKMPLGFAEADRKFHQQVIALASNPRITQAYQLAPVLIQVDVHVANKKQQQIMLKTTAEHEAICEALDNEQFDAAAALLQEHLLDAHSRSNAFHFHS